MFIRPSLFVTQCIALSVLGSGLVSASWELVNDFESGSTTGVTLAISPTLAEDGGNGSISVIADPINAGNQVLKLDSGEYANGTGTNNAWFHLPISGITTKGTVYSRFAKSGDSIRAVWGTTSDDSPATYSDFSTALRIQNDAIFQYRNGQLGYPEIVGSLSVPLTWYETWTVLDVTAKTYDVWIRGGVYTAITNFVTGAGFRNITDGPQDTFYARATTGSPPSPFNSDFTIYDDIWVDTSGENLLTPGLAAVPEPSALGFIFGTLALSLAYGRRRR